MLVPKKRERENVGSWVLLPGGLGRRPVSLHFQSTFASDSRPAVWRPTVDRLTVLAKTKSLPELWSQVTGSS